MKRILLALFQFALSATIFTAIIAQLLVHLEIQANVVNFFSYFTNLSNIIAAIVLLVGGVLTLQSKQSRSYDIIRGASVVYIAVVGVVFSLLLQGLEMGAILPWVNSVLHYISPLLVVVLWFLYPPTSSIPLKKIGLWLLFPAAYLVYSLIRGSIVSWYAYPFLNPSQDGGYVTVTLYSLFILVLFVFFSLVVWLRVKKRS